LSSRAADVVVVGAGVVGACTAHRLAQRGQRVVLLDRSGPCRGTTAATFGWTSLIGKRPLHYFRLNQAAIALHRRLGEELGEELDWRPCFSLRPAMDEHEAEELRADLLPRIAEGYEESWIDGAEARSLVPQLAENTVGAWLCRDEGIVDIFALVYAAIDRARRRGAELRWGEPLMGFQREGDRVVAVRTARGTIPCGAVVLAAGPQTAEVARLAGFSFPMLQARGDLLLTERWPPVFGDVVEAVRQTRSGRFLVGVTWDEERLDPSPSSQDLRKIARRACQMLPFLRQLRVLRSFSGIRPVPGDRVAVVGPVASRPGLHLAVSHSGVTLGPLLAEITADFLAGGRHPAWDERLSPDRFQGELA